MAFLNKLGKKISSAAEATASKAKEMAEITKLKARQSAEEKQIEKIYTEIGQMIYAQDKDNLESPAVELCSKINALQDNIEKIKKKIKKKIEEIKSAADQQAADQQQEM